MSNEEVVLKIRYGVIGGVAGALVAVGGVVWGSHEWMAKHVDAYFFSEAQAGELTEQIKQLATATQQTAIATQQTAKALDRHIKSEDLKEQRQKLDGLKARYADIQLWETTNKPNAVSTQTRRDLEQQIEHTKDYIQCLEAGRENCVP